MIIFHQMLAFLLFMLVGFAMRRKNILDEKGASAISWLIIHITNPALILSGAISGDGVIPASDLIKTVGAGIILYIAMIIAAFFIPKILHVSERETGIYRNMTVFTNIGFMGFPLINALLGAKAVLYASVFIMPYHVLIYTYGIWNFEHYAGRQNSKFNPKSLLNIGVIASLLAIILNFTQPPLPLFLKTAVTHLTNATGTLSMINIGAFLAGLELSRLVSDKTLAMFSGLRMLVVPIIGTFLMKLFVHDPLLLTIGMITMAAPTGSMVAIMANQYDPESDLSVRGVSLNTLLSVITIPLVALITGV